MRKLTVDEVHNKSKFRYLSNLRKNTIRTMFLLAGVEVLYIMYVWSLRSKKECKFFYAHVVEFFLIEYDNARM